MSINTQAARIKHHTVTTAGAFTVPSSEDFTDGSWTIRDLAKSEIGVNENDGTAFIRIGAAIKELQTGAGSNLGSNDLTSSDPARVFTLNGNLASDTLEVKRGDNARTHLLVAGSGLARMGHSSSATPYVLVNPGATISARLQASNSQYIDFGTLGMRIAAASGSIIIAGTGTMRIGADSAICYWKDGNMVQGTVISKTFTGTNSGVKEIGTAPSNNQTGFAYHYVNDDVSGEAFNEFRNDNGDIIKLYKETNAVAAATQVINLGGNITDTSTFGGYTVAQIVGALQAQGLLQ